MEHEEKAPVKGGFWIGLGSGLTLSGIPVLYFVTNLSENTLPFLTGFGLIMVLVSIALLASNRYRTTGIGMLAGTAIIILGGIMLLLLLVTGMGHH